MKFGLSTGTFYIYPLRTLFRWARQASFDTAELVVNPEAIARGGAALRRMATEEGMPIGSVHPTVLRLPGWWERRGGMERTIPLALETGAGTLVMHTPRAETLEAGEGLAFRRRVERWQSHLAAPGSGLRLAVENKSVRTALDQRYALTPVEQLRAFADRYDLDLVLDTMHAGSAGVDLLYACEVFGGRLVEVHLSDTGGHVPLGHWRLAQDLWSQHRFPGAGRLALAELVAALAAGGFEGTVVLEINPVAARIWWPPAARRRLDRAVAWLRQAAGRNAR
ncbi:MAG TPA: TIM barrel protein [Anaerolineae bacterium]|nr:TIM barrel protein [Anaerolineae bacterium]